MKTAHRNFADVTAATGDLVHFMHRWCEAEQDKVCAIAARDPRLMGRHIAAEDMAELERRLALMLAWRHLRDIGYRAHVIAEAIAFFYGVGRAALRRMWAAVEGEHPFDWLFYLGRDLDAGGARRLPERPSDQLALALVCTLPRIALATRRDLASAGVAVQ